MKNTVIVAAFIAAFGSTFAAAQTVCVTDPSGLSQSCTEDDAPIVNNTTETPIYPTGEMPRDSDLPATIDKVNFLDNATIAHRKSIGNLYATKVDKETFEADQKRQDDQVSKVGQTAQAAQANSNTAITASATANRNAQAAQGVAKAASDSASEAKGTAASANATAKNAYNVGVQAHGIASEANENAGIAMNMADEAKAVGTDARKQADYATAETEKLWADKASNANVNELRESAIKESQERIKNDAAESAERIKNDAKEAAERIEGDARNAAGIQRLDNVKADRSEVVELNRVTNESAQGYADRAERNANAYTDQKFDSLQSDMNKLSSQVQQTKRETRAGVAGAAAMANIPTAQELNRLTVGAGAGFYKDQQAVAVGASYRFNTTVTLKGSVSTTGRDTAAGVGASWAL